METALIDAALARAQKVYPPIKKTRKATVKGTTKGGKDYNYDYNYADLADVLTAVLPCLTAEEICVRQPIRRIEGRMYLVTELHHSSGQSVNDDGIPLGPNNDPQAFSAEQSYARRQGLCGLAGVAPEENEDAQVSKTAAQRGKDLMGAQQRTEAASKAAVQQDATPITKEESRHILDELKRTSRKAAQLYEFVGLKVGTPIPASKYAAILAWFKAPIMPENVRKAFEMLDWTPGEQVQFCEAKRYDWEAITAQLDTMLEDKDDVQEA
jgi:ERF superfamily protein